MKDIKYWLQYVGETATNIADPLKDLGNAMIALSLAVNSINESSAASLPEDRFTDWVEAPVSDTLKSKGNK
jgi:hypothetical protein